MLLADFPDLENSNNSYSVLILIMIQQDIFIVVIPLVLYTTHFHFPFTEYSDVQHYAVDTNQLCCIFPRLLRILTVGVVVIGTFALCWLPYLSSVEDIMSVIQRLFPFNRGLFEVYF